MEMSNFIESQRLAYRNMDLTTLEPINVFLFHPLFAKEWCTRLATAIERIEQQKIPLEQVAATFSGAGHLRCQFGFLLFDLKAAKVPKEQRQKMADFFRAVLLHTAKADHAGYQSNIKHTEAEIQAILTKPFKPATPTLARQLGKLYSAAYHLVNGLYTDFYTDYGAENIGPYSLGGNRTLVIKHFADLRPAVLWPDSKAPCKTLTIYSIYENVGFRCDAISVHSIYDGDPIKGLLQYAIEVDGAPVDAPASIAELTNGLETEAVQQWQRLIAQDHETLKQKGLTQRCYTLKGLFELAGMNWEPDDEMRTAVEGKSFATGFWKPPVGEEEVYWTNILNPEAEFYP